MLISFYKKNTYIRKFDKTLSSATLKSMTTNKQKRLILDLKDFEMEKVTTAVADAYLNGRVPVLNKKAFIMSLINNYHRNFIKKENE